ncbi:MAG: DMT family transporter [Pseudomonadota bacterium]
MRKPSRTTANCLLLAAGAIWGMGFIAQSTAMDAIEPVIFTGVRFAMAALALLPFAIWEARRVSSHDAATRTPLPIAILIGSFLFGALVTQQIGLVTTTVTNSGFLTAIYVILVPIFSAVILRVVPRPITWLCAAMTLVGIAMLTGFASDGFATGDLWTLACAAIWAGHVVLVGVYAPATSFPFRLATIQFAVCAALGITMGLAIEFVTFASLTLAWREILFAGIVSGGLAFTIQIIAQRHTTSSQAAIFLSSEALFAALFGAIFLGERVGAVGYVGCAIIFTAMLLVELRGGTPRMAKETANHAS